MIGDIPTGWAAIIVAFLALVGAFFTARYGRVSRLERENRQLWFVVQALVHTLYANGIEPDDELVALINGKDSS